MIPALILARFLSVTSIGIFSGINDVTIDDIISDDSFDVSFLEASGLRREGSGTTISIWFSRIGPKTKEKYIDKVVTIVKSI